ncbi:IS701 family transposase [Belnapia sp. T18]|uniref:IS701 family transposase n=1 Tax=Belnapia arida TaxID=2804533 RepID=A0ABS1UDQ4_9PROT|nr:IS701 family transposase [Belnapia arida]MBL6082650.1 IS701 family transposase [Belnapia arida]
MSGLGWQTELGQWLAPFLDALGHPARRAMCPLYVAGLIGPGDRKSTQPMAERLGLASHDGLHHFVSTGVWDAAPLEAALMAEADRLVGGENAWLVGDDTALPKKGKHSVGVTPQYATTLGKNANCQTLVSLTLAGGEVPVPVALRLFLPEGWTGDLGRLDKAGVPDAWRGPCTKPQMALAEIDRALAAGVRFRAVLADAGYGLSAPFRQGLSERGLAWAVGIPRHQKLYPADVELIFPSAGRGRPRQHAIPDALSVPAEVLLRNTTWRKVSWRHGTKGPLSAKFAAQRIRIADGPPQRIHDAGAQHMPGEEAWVVGEHRASGERKYYLSNLPADISLKALAAAIKARWVCEQAHQQLKEELGLDHFEGRSWTGLHRHALMTMIALAFLQHRRLAEAARGKKASRTTASTQPARRARRTRRPADPHPNTTTMPTLPQTDQHAAQS